MKWIGHLSLRHGPTHMSFFFLREIRAYPHVNCYKLTVRIYLELFFYNNLFEILILIFMCIWQLSDLGIRNGLINILLKAEA